MISLTNIHNKSLHQLLEMRKHLVFRMRLLELRGEKLNDGVKQQLNAVNEAIATKEMARSILKWNAPF